MMENKDFENWKAKIETELADLKKRVEELEGKKPQDKQSMTWN